MKIVWSMAVPEVPDDAIKTRFPGDDAAPCPKLHNPCRLLLLFSHTEHLNKLGGGVVPLGRLAVTGISTWQRNVEIHDLARADSSLVVMCLRSDRVVRVSPPFPQERHWPCLATSSLP